MYFSRDPLDDEQIRKIELFLRLLRRLDPKSTSKGATWPGWAQFMSTDFGSRNGEPLAASYVRHSWHRTLLPRTGSSEPSSSIPG